MSNGSIRPEIRFETDYLRTYHGMLKCGLLIMGIINVITINTTSFHNNSTDFYNTTLGFAWFYTLIMLILFLFHIPEKTYTLPWLPVEIGFICIFTLFYFIASLLALLAPHFAHTLAGLFGFITTLGYAYSGYLKFKAWKNGELAQGSLSQSNTASTQASAFPA